MLITPTLEHIARTIAGSVGSHNYTNACWALHVSEAHAALTALREPTPEMLEAVRPFLHADWVTPFLAQWEVAVEAGLGEVIEPSPFILEQQLAEIEEVLRRIQGMGGQG